MRAYREAKHEEQAAKGNREDAEKHLLRALEDSRRKNYEFEENGRFYRATRVAAERAVIDEDGLRKELGARNFARVTKVTVDRKKLEDAVHQGLIPQEVVGKHIRLEQNKPSIRYTTGEAKGEDT